MPDLMDQAQEREQLERDAAIRHCGMVATDLVGHGPGPGICRRCEEDIDPARLVILPGAAHCTPCQIWLDRQAKAGR